jgi:hypothetical protein
VNRKAGSTIRINLDDDNIQSQVRLFSRVWFISCFLSRFWLVMDFFFFLFSFFLSTFGEFRSLAYFRD